MLLKARSFTPAPASVPRNGRRATLTAASQWPVSGGQLTPVAGAIYAVRTGGYDAPTPTPELATTGLTLDKNIGTPQAI